MKPVLGASIPACRLRPKTPAEATKDDRMRSLLYGALILALGGFLSAQDQGDDHKPLKDSQARVEAEL